MRFITLVLFGLTLVAAHGGNLTSTSMVHLTPSVPKIHSDDSVLTCTPTPGYVLAAESRDIVRTAKPLSPRQKNIAAGTKEDPKAIHLIRITPLIATALDLRPVEE